MRLLSFSSSLLFLSQYFPRDYLVTVIVISLRWCVCVCMSVSFQMVVTKLVMERFADALKSEKLKS